MLSLEIRDERIRNGWSVGRSICGDENNDDDVSGLCSGGLYELNGAMLRQPLISSRMNSCCSLLAFFIVNVS